MTKTATKATTATTRCGTRMRTRTMNNEGLDDENDVDALKGETN